MKKMLFGLCAIVLLLGVQAQATPLISDSGYGISNVITANSINYTVFNYRQGTDSWVGSGYTGSDFTGIYIGTVSAANDSEADLSNLLNYYLGAPYTETYAFLKVEEPYSTSGGLEIIYGIDNKVGTWSLSGDLKTLLYSVKGGTGYALYYLDPSLSSGLWTTGHLLNNGNQQPAISHLTVAIDPNQPVPEPATLLLFGTGLAGLAGVARRVKL